MKYRAFILIALVLVCSVFAAEKSQHETKEVAQNEIKGDETKHTNTHVGHGGGTGVDAGAWFMGRGGGMAGGMGGGGGGAPAGGGMGGGGGGGGAPAGGAGGGRAGGYSGGFSHGGVYGGGQICKWGCCSESHGYRLGSGGYYGCTCCSTAAEAKAYKETRAKVEIKN